MTRFWPVQVREARPSVTCSRNVGPLHAPPSLHLGVATQVTPTHSVLGRHLSLWVPVSCYGWQSPAAEIRFSVPSMTVPSRSSMVGAWSVTLPRASTVTFSVEMLRVASNRSTVE